MASLLGRSQVLRILFPGLTICKLVKCKDTTFVVEWDEKLGGNGPTDEPATVTEVSVANFNFTFEISNLNYPGIHVHVASNSHLGGL